MGMFSNKRGGRDASLNLRPLSVEMTPDRPFYAIGDVHGCFDHLQAALEKIDADIDAQTPVDPAVVFLGDYIDRGPASSEVLEFLMELCLAEPDAAICLRGNHEQMLLDFIDDPIKQGPRWLKFGGAETLESYGLESEFDMTSKEALYEACESLLDALPEGMESWMRHLPLHWSSGNMHCVHAAMDPSAPVNRQSQKTLLWGHEQFEKEARKDGNWVVHGHTVVDTPRWENSRVSLDTGCYQTGRLTAAAFTGGTCRIL